MSPIKTSGMISLSALMLSANIATAQNQYSKPNIVFILADDLGWSDTQLYGTSTYYQTPNILRLAKKGVTFYNAYSASPLCSPTRASIMTGLYPARTGITQPYGAKDKQIRTKAMVTTAKDNTRKVLETLTVNRFGLENITIAEELKQAGYHTAHFGKWHLGADPFSPLQQGFDSDWPHTPSPQPTGGYLAPWEFLSDTIKSSPGEHIEDRMSKMAASYIKANAKSGQPFYLNYWAFSVHSPWSAKPELVEKYAKMVPRFSTQRNPVYAAMVQSLDEAVGRLLDAIEQSGIEKNTIIIFFSDNGGNTWTPGETSPKGYGFIPATSNLPLREGKSSLYEGGTKVPMVVAWPGKIKAASTTEALFSSVDFYPTLLNMIGVKPFNPLHLDGISQTQALFDNKQVRDTAYCFFPHFTPLVDCIPGVWIRIKDWKLIRFFNDNPDQTDRLVLYNLKNDLNEAHDLSDRFVDKTKEMNLLLDRYLEITKAVVPVINPEYKYKPCSK